MRMRRALASLAALVVTLPASVAISSAGAAAADTAMRTAAGVVELEGRGYGHGRGLSQWGAYGAADAGLTWQQILSFYYPGTERRQLSNSAIRVWISADNDNETRVWPTPGASLSLASSGRSAVLPAGAAYDAWRIVRNASGLVLQRQDGGSWHAHTSPVPLGSDATFTSSSGLIRLYHPNNTFQTLRGGIRAVPYGSSPGVRTVAVLPMEQYLRSVVPAEMPASWPAHAVRAQSVAARSYAARLRAGATTQLWDTCDTVSCQVFRGTAFYRTNGTLISSGEHSLSDAAITATAGTVLYFQPSAGAAQIALTEFSAANGGYTAAGSSSQPYLIAKPDPYDGRIPSTAHAWTASVSASKIESAFPETGTFRQMAIDRRNGLGEWGGRVVQATVTGSRGSVQVSGDTMRSRLGLKSNWFRFAALPAFPRDGDLNGTADLIAIDRSAALWFYPGRGDGTFGTRRHISNGWASADLVTQAGDWDGDGAQDILARAPLNGGLFLYRGDGRGAVRYARQIGWGWNGVDLLLGPGDWDGDGLVDLLARSSRDGSLWLYPGDGRGSYNRPREVGRGWHVFQNVAAVGDMTGDGHPDLVARAGSRLLVYPGNGRGGWLAAREIGTGWNVIDLLQGPGDWDGDGRVDLLARRTDGRMYVYPGVGDGTLGSPRHIGTGWTGYRVAL